MEKRKQLNLEKWGHAGKYSIETVNGKEYIRPVSESGYIYYDFNILNDEKSGKRANENYIVLAMLNLDTSNNKEILKFVDRFGLLGLLQHKYLEPMVATIKGEEHYLVPERNGTLLHPTDEIAKKYLINENDFREAGFYFARNTMSEPLDEFVDTINEFQTAVKWAYAIKKAEQGISGPLRSLFLKDPYLQEHATKDMKRIIPMAKHYLSIALTDGDLGLNRTVVQIGETWDAKWGFTSLLSAAYFLFTQDMGGHYRLDECPRCGRLFLSAVSTRMFCSRKCEDANRKTKKRKGGEE